MNYWKYREKTEEFYVYIGLMPPKELRTCKWVLHHKDIHLRDTDYNRYRKYLINDVVPMTWSEHKQLHRDLEKLLNDTKKYGSEGEKHPMYGKHHSTETKDKISKSESGSNHWNWGKHHSDETRQKISNNQKGKVLSETHRKQISDKNSKCVLCVNTVTQEQLEFKNQLECAEYFGCTSAMISGMLHNKTGFSNPPIKGKLQNWFLSFKEVDK